MGEIKSKLTVFFDGTFWVGVFEKTEGGKLSVSNVVFGTEPKDSDVYAFIEKNYFRLKYSPAVSITEKATKPNPKRIQREVRKQLHESGIGTKSQQALKLQQEENKLLRKEKSHRQKLAEKERRFELKQQKKKDKRNGH